MKATGIVRRIDDLGRIVIPKEIRRTLRLRDGDALEIFTEKNGEVIFKKYSPVAEMFEFATSYCDALFKGAGCAVCVFDRDGVIASAGIPKKDITDAKLPPRAEELFELRKQYVRKSGDEPITVGMGGMCISVLSPISSEGEIVGAIAALNDGRTDSEEAMKLLIATAAVFLGKQLS
ncbi:MAG: stage V sporulation T C-terminal domain-containing protein [Oscillospiraceae bacterium]|nr:stage V sporulation T C-terminal domain-containing protein [Oscillospiraceae bacterium]